MGRKTAAAKTITPTTVAERRRTLRAAKAPASSTAVRKVEIDLADPSARKALSSLYPSPVDELMIPATPELEAAALAYVEARDSATLANERKEAAGNVLCNAIGRHLGIEGDGWRAEWSLTKGSVDWTRLAKDKGIPDEEIAPYRKPSSRTLTVREVAEE